LLFTSFSFVGLVAVTMALYYLRCTARYQVAVLIAASLAFYAYGQPLLLSLLLFSALTSAACSHGVLVSRSRRSRVAWSASGVVLNLGLLAIFKYNRLLAELVVGELSSASGPAQWVLTLPLPIGISFYTFHGISLLVDTLRLGKLQSAGDETAPHGFGRHLGHTLLYLTFFPQLVAGPIAKAHFFYPQIGAKAFPAIDWQTAIKCLITGYFLKMVVADNLQHQTIWIAYPYFLHFPLANLAGFLVAYSVQIFADFAGYSLIAVGLAALFGYRLPQNFNFPYISQSVTEFWQRWHMSLSAWLKDYLYIPLGGNRHGRARTYLNLMIVMFLGGLWHGAALSYAVWGACHGVALAIERFFGSGDKTAAVSWLAQALRITAVFTFVSLAWLLFKLPNFDEVLQYLQAMAANRSMRPIYWYLVIIGFFSTPVVLYHAAHLYRSRLTGALIRFGPACYGAMLAAIVTNYGPSSAFIYFQF
jgi:alginate O-acetyltransferase complex protein AlgI